MGSILRSNMSDRNSKHKLMLHHTWFVLVCVAYVIFTDHWPHIKVDSVYTRSCEDSLHCLEERERGQVRSKTWTVEIPTDRERQGKTLYTPANWISIGIPIWQRRIYGQLGLDSLDSLLSAPVHVIIWFNQGNIVSNCVFLVEDTCTSYLNWKTTVF